MGLVRRQREARPLSRRGGRRRVLPQYVSNLVRWYRHSKYWQSPVARWYVVVVEARCLPPTTYHSPLTTHYLLLTARHAPPTVLTSYTVLLTTPHLPQYEVVEEALRRAPPRLEVDRAEQRLDHVGHHLVRDRSLVRVRVRIQVRVRVRVRVRVSRPPSCP